MRAIIISFILLSVSACMATGPNFVSLNDPANGSSGVYIMRQSAFVGAAYCPPVSIDNTNIGCLKNGGYLYKELAPGKHELRFERRLLEIGKDTFVNFNINNGETMFFEWSTWINDVYVVGPIAGVTGSDGVKPHNKESALKLLPSLKSHNK